MDCSLPASSVQGFSRQEYWSGLPCPPPGDLPDPGIKPRSLALQMDSSLSEPPGKPIFSSVQSLRYVQLFATPWTEAHQASLYVTNSQRLLKLSESVMPSNHFIPCCLLLLPNSSFLASGSFPVSQFLASGGQSIGVSASASVFPMNIQD